MTDWPSTLKAGPIAAWPGELTKSRVASKFKAGLKDTLQVLDREIEHLTENRTQRDSLEMLIAIPAGSDSWRIDGRPRANAIPAHPGVILSLDSRFGHLSYPCDTFTTWQDNLRAVALALEALRKVDRYGVTKRGEQYRGFLALEAGVAGQSGFVNAASAEAYVRNLADIQTAPLVKALQRAKYDAHPDHGGDPDTFSRVMLAEGKLRQEGLLR